MQLCSRCNGAIHAGQRHCPICDLPVVADQTWVQGPSTPPAAPSYPAPQPAYGPPPGYGPPTGYGPPGYGAGPSTPPKSKAAAALLCFFLGSLGIHRFYTGQVPLGLALLLTTLILGPLTCGLWFVATFVWVMVDFVLILTGGVTDEWGRPLV